MSRPLRKLVHIFAMNDDGSGRIVAPLVELEWAELICSSVEAFGYRVLVDPPIFGMGQNIIGWSPESYWVKEGLKDTVPWREYLEVRGRVERTADAFNELYERVDSEDKYGDAAPRGRARP